VTADHVSSDFHDPERNIRAAIGRAEWALDLYQQAPPAPADVLEQLEKAHSRLERAQAEVVAYAIAAGSSWDDVASVLGLSNRQAKARFGHRVE
jgi:DNA-directed RNA polymerase specialized sigma24 family protein